MADKIVKMQPIPTWGTEHEIRKILSDMKVADVSIRGDAAYVKFHKFDEDDQGILEFTFEENKYQKGGWDADVIILPASDWDSSEEELIDNPAEPKHEEPEEIKKPVEDLSAHKVEPSQDLSAPKVQPIVDFSAHQVQPTEDFSAHKVEPSVQETEASVHESVPAPTETERVRQHTEEVSVPEELIVERKVPQIVIPKPMSYESQIQQPSLVKPVGTKSEVQILVNDVKEAVAQQLAPQSGLSIPAWIWPAALAWTMLSLSMH